MVTTERKALYCWGEDLKVIRVMRFFPLGLYKKNRVYVTSLPYDLSELRHRTEEVTASIIPHLLTEVWERTGLEVGCVTYN